MLGGIAERLPTGGCTGADDGGVDARRVSRLGL